MENIIFSTSPLFQVDINFHALTGSHLIYYQVSITLACLLCKLSCLLITGSTNAVSIPIRLTLPVCVSQDSMNNFLDVTFILNSAWLTTQVCNDSGRLQNRIQLREVETVESGVLFYTGVVAMFYPLSKTIAQRYRNFHPMDAINFSIFLREKEQYITSTTIIKWLCCDQSSYTVLRGQMGRLFLPSGSSIVPSWAGRMPPSRGEIRI